MTLSGYYIIHVKIRFRPAPLDSERLTFKNNCVKSNNQRPVLSTAEMQVNDSSFWQHKLFLDIRKRSWDYWHQIRAG